MLWKVDGLIYNKPSEEPIPAFSLPIIPTGHRTTAIVFGAAPANLHSRLGRDVNLDGTRTHSINLTS
jgi:hypothetical protein